ncbi:hypothetical protein E6R18_25055 [Streptomyces sp. A1277]|uniref:DUF6093 family protein n=1 Tax=Streptomyces sp. A1277 TaxID=2563103 RepID=UPI0010A23108|nr:DUF6093 family protein [Streptomyces sp. A1277]THA29183.1 hypothetical protein E6R18_25055 [Streptomyces sp. A1277]
MAGLDGALAGVVAWVEDNICIDTVRISVPSTADPVLNEDTGQLEYPPDEVLYDGPGAVQGSSAQELSATPGALTPWTQETTSRYRLLTPLAAPIAPKDAIVTVVAVHDTARTALLGRSWTCQDPGRAGTVEVVRITPLDQNQEPAGGAAA